MLFKLHTICNGDFLKMGWFRFLRIEVIIIYTLNNLVSKLRYVYIGIAII